MTVITEHAEHATLINIFTVEPDRASQLANLLAKATEDVMRHIDGFISANIHASVDGTRVVNYAQWRNADAFQAMLGNAAAQEHMSKCAQLATAYDPHLYTVESVHTA